MSEALPKRLPKTYKAAIRIFKADRNWINGRELREKGNGAFDGIKNISSTLKELERREFIERHPSGNTAYRLTKYGHKTFDALDNIPDSSPNIGRKPAKPKQLTIPEPPKPKLNLSTNTEKMVDVLGVVIQENAKYREILMDIYTLIGERLELNKEESL